MNADSSEEGGTQSTTVPISFSGFLNQTRHALGVLDLAGRVLTLNAAAERIFGDEKPRLLGRPLWELPCFDGRAELQAQLAGAVEKVRSGSTETLQVSIDASDSEQGHVELSLAPFRNDRDIVAGVIVEGIDVTLQVEAIHALADSEHRYRCIFDTNPAVKLVINPETGAVVDANASALQFYGYSRDELRSLRIQEINTLPEADVRREMELARTERRLFFNFKHRLADGQIRDVEVYSGPINVAGEQLLHSIIVDVTDRRQLEERLARSERMEAIGQLAGGVAHDFNNILTVVLGYVELAERQLSAEHPAMESVREIGNATRRASDLTQDLLSLSRKNISVREPVDIGETVLRTDRFLRRLIGENVELAAVVEPDVPLAEVNSGRFQQALVNLVVNARDAILDRGRITIRVAPADGRALGAEHAGTGAVEVSVTDTGTGIAPEHLPSIFDPLFTTKESQGGTGFGLATCKNIVEAVGGKISVKSRLGQGTTFTILLPACAGAESDSAQTSEELAPTASGTVLLAEDEPAVRRLMASTLSNAGYEVVEAENGDVAIRLFEAEPARFDIVVTDVVMPLLGGPELARRIALQRPDLPVLFVSGYPADLDPRALDSDSKSFLSKPFTGKAVLGALEELLPEVRSVRRLAPNR